MSVAGLRGRTARWVVRLSALLALFCAAPVAAQEPVPRDTVVVPVPPEGVAQDTFPREAAASPPDTLRPVSNLPAFPRAPAAGFALGQWEWDQAALQRWHGMSLLSLLEQVPGLLVTRGGWHGRPAGIAAFGAGGGRTRVFLDGFELDPLEAATFDVQHVAITDLESLRVERSLTETRIELFTFRHPEPRAFSRIEAATGDFQTRILRGIFSTPMGGRSLLTLGLDLTDTEGWAGAQPYSTNSLLARWTYAPGRRTGLQLEYRQTALERAGAPFLLQGDRRDLVLRARSQLAPRFTVDAQAGRSWRSPGEPDTLQVELESVQGVVRARYDAGLVWLGGGTRVRGGDRVGFVAPSFDVFGEAGLRPVPWLHAEGRARNARAGDFGGSELEGGVRLGPLAGLSLFATAATGSRAIGVFGDSIIEVEVPNPEPPGDPILRPDTLFLFPSLGSRLHGVRLGAEWSGWGARFGGAYIRHDLDTIAPFGLAFDRTLPPAAADAVDGVEAYLSVPIWWRALRVEGSYVRWSDTGGRPYLPTEHGRFGLVFNERFYDGNLEPTLRIEGVRRGSAVVPNPERTQFAAVTAPYTIYNLLLQIRILDVQAFLIWENLLNTFQAADLVGPGRTMGGQRAIYGVRWHFLD
jgi:hypothetical protein